MKNTFFSDLKYGKIGEQAILDIIKSKYFNAYIKNGYEKKYDIYIPEKDVEVEVKTDRKSRETTNIAIECEYKGYKSGIRTTTADYWVIIFWDDDDSKWKYGVCKTSKIKSLCRLCRKIPAGSGAKVHLVSKSRWKLACSSLGKL